MIDQINTSEIKTKFQDKEIFEEKEKTQIKLQRNKAGTNSVIFAKLFLLSYDTFFNNSHVYKIDLDKFKTKAEKLRSLIEEYDNCEINKYFPEAKIKNEIDRDIMNKLINLFFEVFMEDDE